MPGGTYRENFYGEAGKKCPPDDHVAAKYHWRAGEEPPKLDEGV